MPCRLSAQRDTCSWLRAAGLPFSQPQSPCLYEGSGRTLETSSLERGQREPRPQAGGQGSWGEIALALLVH